MAASDGVLCHFRRASFELALTVPRLWLRPLSEADLATVLETEAACYPQPWSRSTFADCIKATSKGYHCDALMLGESLAGHSVFTVIMDEAELLNFCLAPAHQGQGLAKLFLNQVLADMAALGAARMFLEVRQSNAAALHLYTAAGFNEIGRRKNYYPDNGSGKREDALLMGRSANG